jgi:mannitol/fructose-specific phosphotransferase system IIA component (Ntr-type)
MQSIVNHLIQLQELTLVRDEQKVSKGGTFTAQLDESITEMKSRLPVPVATQFDRLHSKHPTVITPVSEDICSMCGMRLPISLVQAVRLLRELQYCPNCARILYYPEEAPRWVGKAPRRCEPRKVGISRFSSQALMIPRLVGETKEEVIAELAKKMEEEGYVDRADRLVTAALRREAIISTAVDHNLAFPHVRGVEGGGLTLALGVSKKGVHFDDPKAPLTRIVFFLTIPTAASAFYLKLLAGLTETFMVPDNRKALLEPEEPAALWKTLVKLTRPTIK